MESWIYWVIRIDWITILQLLMSVFGLFYMKIVSFDEVKECQLHDKLLSHG